MKRHVLLVLAIALLSYSLPSAQTADPAPSKGPFTVEGSVQGVSLQQIANGLGSVTAITHAGDGRLFITIRDGRIVIFENGAVRPQPFLDIRSQVASGGERGLLSTAFHPDYAQNGFFFINYSNLNGQSVIARYQVSADPNRADAGSARTLLTINRPASNHNGGQLQFGPDGYLYFGMGDSGNGFDPECAAQRTDNLLGKILRIDIDQNVNQAPFYGIPADNPFRGPGNPPDEIWATGFRNPWRFSFDRETGDLWIGDVGQNHREEIDFQPANSNGGENYGWKVMEGTLCSTTEACPASTPACNSAAFTPPVLEYDHDNGCSVSGGYVYRGSQLPQLRGSYLFGDFCNGKIWAASRQGDGFVVRTLPGQASQLTTFGEDAQGELYAATLTGRLLRISGEAVQGKAETVGLYEPQAGRFHLKSANSAAASARVVRFGPRRSRWIPLAGDWDGDGTTTRGLYDQRTGTFRLKNSSPGGGSDIILRVDAPSDEALPIVGNWDGQGGDTIGLHDPATNSFYLKNSLSGSGFDIEQTLLVASTNRLVPVAGDWNGDSMDSVGLFDPTRAIFFLENGIVDNQAPDLQIVFGSPGRNVLPVIGDWDGNGTDGLGVYDPTSAVFKLRNALSAGPPDLQFRFGPRRGGWKPLAGAW